MIEEGILSLDERRLKPRVTDADRIATLSDRKQLYLELGTPRMNGYGFIIREQIGMVVEYRVGIYDWKRDECPEKSFEEFKRALDYLLSHLSFA